MQDWVFGQILAMALVLGPPSLRAFSRTPIGKAITRRIMGQSTTDNEKLDEVHGAVLELQEMMDRVGTDIEDLQERVSFAERLLTSGAEAEKELTPV